MSTALLDSFADCCLLQDQLLAESSTAPSQWTLTAQQRNSMDLQKQGSTDALQTTPLVDLPAALLLLIMQHLANGSDYKSWASAARAHSALHTAAAPNLRSITLSDFSGCHWPKLLAD